MDSQFRDHFQSQWKKYFGEAELPIAYYYTDRVPDKDRAGSDTVHRCLIGNLGRVREGHPFVYQGDTEGCSGGKRYTGFSKNLRPNFEFFLSCGIPGEMEGERYKQSPELVRAYLESHPPFDAPGKYLVFKRWDQLADGETPLAVIFFARPDVLSGLFALANYDSADPQAVITPMGSGCASIIGYPYEETKSKNPKCVLGLFDVSARPCVPADRLTFTIPMRRLEQLIPYMDESFLTTASWKAVKNRI
ncbi:MAG: DUF169 domain-containing protein [Anaerolineales bacterium]|jgi:uncharacterized protein (DUF169 family)